MTSAYKNTTVPIARSQESIRKLLINFGVRGVQFSEDFETRNINVKFAYKRVSGKRRRKQPLILSNQTFQKGE